MNRARKILTILSCAGMCSIFGFTVVRSQVIIYGMKLDSIRSIFDSIEIRSTATKHILFIHNARIGNSVGTYECALNNDSEVVFFQWTSLNNIVVSSDKIQFINELSNTLGAPVSILVNDYRKSVALTWSSVERNVSGVYKVKVLNGKIDFVLNEFHRRRGLR